MGLPTFLVPTSSLQKSSAKLTGEEARHLRVRRVQVGEVVRLIDGAGGVRHGAVERILRGTVLVRFIDGPAELSESPLETFLGIPPIRAERLERALEKATELGVHHILLFRCTRCRPYDARRRMARWQRILLEATKQCQRLRVPNLSMFSSLEEMIANVPASLRLFFDPGPEARPLSALKLDAPPKSVLLIVGPEGGFTSEEASVLRESGGHPITLGSRTLRAETAALAALTLVQFHWGDLGRTPTAEIPSLRAVDNTRTLAS